MINLVSLALYANASTLGIHWIYDVPFLQQLAKTQSLFFLKQSKAIFDQAKPSYYAYPHADIGDVTIQGMALAWLYRALKNNPNLTVEEYKKLLLTHTRPGGTYVGYIETYLRTLIVNDEIESLKLPLQTVEINDDHLIGFVPYLACKQLGLPTTKAIELASLFTAKSEYAESFAMFDYILENLNKRSIQEVLSSAILLGPKRYQVQLKKALEMTDTPSFVKHYAGPACAINQSIPIMIHLLNHVTSFEDMLMQNALIGGSISERGMLLAAITGQLYPLSIDPLSKLSKNLLSILVG
jgi:hypothetical protein